MSFKTLLTVCLCHCDSSTKQLPAPGASSLCHRRNHSCLSLALRSPHPILWAIASAQQLTAMILQMSNLPDSLPLYEVSQLSSNAPGDGLKAHETTNLLKLNLQPLNGNCHLPQPEATATAVAVVGDCHLPHPETPPLSAVVAVGGDCYLPHPPLLLKKHIWTLPIWPTIA